MMDKLLTYGLNGNELKHVSEVNTGLACNCVCAKCGYPLVAKNSDGNIKVAHFAHDTGRECKGAVETTLHLLAKTVLFKRKKLRVPDYHFDYNPARNSSMYKEGCVVYFDGILLEQTVQVGVSCIVPDAVGKIDDRTIYIEFANTHFTEKSKKEKLKELDIACIEVDISKQELDEKKLNEFFQSKESEIYWIQNPFLDAKYKKEMDYKKKLKDWKRSERKRKEQLKKEQLEKVAFEKYIMYKSNSKLMVSNYNPVTNRVAKCPKKELQQNELRTSNFYQHPVLRMIIDGEFWNGEIYGRIPNAKFIYLAGKKIDVYPNEQEWLNSDLDQQRYSKTFFAGLKWIQRKQSDFTIGRCESCTFAQDTFTYQNHFYSVCNFNSQTNESV